MSTPSSSSGNGRLRRFVIFVGFMGVIWFALLQPWMQSAIGFNGWHIMAYQNGIRSADWRCANKQPEDIGPDCDIDAVYERYVPTAQRAGNLTASVHQLNAIAANLATVKSPLVVDSGSALWQLDNIHDTEYRQTFKGIPVFKGRVQIRVRERVTSKDCGYNTTDANGVPKPGGPFCKLELVDDNLPYLAAIGRRCPAEGCSNPSSFTSPEAKFLVGTCLDLDAAAVNGVVNLVVNEGRHADYFGDNTGDYVVEYEHNPATGCRGEQFTY
ncbi:MAG: hypothetical protein HYV13_01830 [Candidatus Doudnabacteria bacterium]|nr:hypothetical protein [Candidatus Doudnabacteria bacterium]